MENIRDPVTKFLERKSGTPAQLMDLNIVGASNGSVVFGDRCGFDTALREKEWDLRYRSYPWIDCGWVGQSNGSCYNLQSQTIAH
jgi:hypothetical protein